MPNSQLRRQRDTFIAFSLAAADLLIEIDGNYVIQQVVGAVKTLLGREETEVIGHLLQELVPEGDRPFIRQLLDRARRSGRIDPTVHKLTISGTDTVAVSIGATWLPKQNGCYVSLTILPELVLNALPERDAVTGLMDVEAFGRVARQQRHASRQGETDLQLFHLQGLPQQLDRLPAVRAKAVMSEIGGLLRSMATDSGLATQLDADKFGVVARQSDARQLLGLLQNRVEAVLKDEGIKDPAVTTVAETVNLDLKGLDAAGTARALAHALKTFAESGCLGSDNLKDCLEKAVQTTSGHLKRLRQTIEANDFDLHFQPVVDLATRDVHHYEALLRVKQGQSPFETVTFSEDIGLCCDLDMAVLSRAIAALKENPSPTVAVNLSGMSLQSESFSSRLFGLLDRHKAIASRLCFEITESASISDFDDAVGIINMLRRRGHTVCIDDFGAGAAAYNYLRKFDVDYVKIDGAFVAEAQRDKRQRSLLKSLAVLCHELGTQVIAEMIETEATASFIQGLGIGFGQGYLFGRPESLMPRTGYNGRRRGAQESWG